ncbi:MAG: NAAT family transporter [Rhodocyclaceae bacterium]|jgi:multiple antibiotic resistance protein|nr:NAAT family transporter [Rhodocyclaceae bacterium]
MVDQANTFQHYLLGLFAVANNIPAIAPFLALVGGLTAVQSLRITAVASFSAFLIMVVSMLAGAGVLAFFGISISAFQIAGGILLGGTGMSMLSSKSTSGVGEKSVASSADQESALLSQAIVPIAMPLTAGAGTISTVTLFSESAARTGTTLELFLAISVMSVVIFLIFHYAISLIKILGQTGMSVLIKVMGLFTLAIGVQFIVSGVSTIYRGLIT